MTFHEHKTKTTRNYMNNVTVKKNQWNSTTVREHLWKERVGGWLGECGRKVTGRVWEKGAGRVEERQMWKGLGKCKRESWDRQELWRELWWELWWVLWRELWQDFGPARLAHPAQLARLARLAGYNLSLVFLSHWACLPPAMTWSPPGLPGAQEQTNENRLHENEINWNQWQAVSITWKSMRSTDNHIKCMKIQETIWR